MSRERSTQSRSAFRKLSVLAGAIACTAFAAAPASASETRGFLVSWFHTAQYFDKTGSDCPHGINPGPEQYYRRELAKIGKSQAEIDDYIKKFLDLSHMADNTSIVQMRGRVDGKPADVYANPTSVDDPHIYTVEGKYGYGFNLDGRDKPGDLIDPETNEHGVDNQLYKATGCTQEIRPHAADEYAPLPTSYWSVVVEVMPALLIEVSGIDDYKNDDDITVSFYRAQERAQRDSNGGMLGGMTFRVDPNPRWHVSVHGHIKDGVITTDVADMNIATDPFVMPEFKFKNARLRLAIDEQGNMRGRLGAYHDWYPFYWIYGVGTWGVEATNNIDLPGLYYALRRLADADPDPKTGENRGISLAYQIDAVPAFIIHGDKTALMDAPGRSSKVARDK